MLVLSRHRWTLPLLAQLARTGGSRFVPLIHQLGVSRDSLRQTLDALIEAGFVMPNPGYGHPTRPEYVLTERGRQIAPACAQLVDRLRRDGVEDVALRKWSLPILAALEAELRFGELRRAVGATPRALTLALKDLVAAGLVRRHVHDGFPPSTSYGVTQRGRPLRGDVARLGAALAAAAIQA
jgi:DNA-binding HxlR family transcriptional regulator